MSKRAVDDVLGAIAPKPKVVEIAGTEFEFWTLDLADHAAVKKETGRDLTQEIFRAKGRMDFVDSELMLAVLYASMKKSELPIAKDLTREDVAKLIAHGLGGFSAGAPLFQFAVNGPESKDEGAGDSGNKK